MEKNVAISLVILIIGGMFLLLGGSNYIEGAATAELNQPIFYMAMDDGPEIRQAEVLDTRGPYSTPKWGGKVNAAWKFNGHNDYLVSSSNHLQSLKEFTIMFWMKPADLNLLRRGHMLWEGEHDLANRGENGGNGWGPQQELHISLGDEVGLNKYKDHKLTFYLGDQQSSLKISKDISKVNWQHVAVTVRNTDKSSTAKMYLDGVLIGEQTSKRIERDRWDGTMFLGKSTNKGPSTDSRRYYHGMLDELTIYDKVLSADQIYKKCRRQNKGEICGK
jgi:hypothetical protein